MIASSRGVVLLVVAIGATACQRDLRGAPCPCVEGWRCSAEHTCVQGPFTLLIDDMSALQVHGEAGTSNAYWYTYSDRQRPNSEPVDILDGAPGSVSPSEGVSFPASDDGTGPEVNGQHAPYRKVDGGGEMKWGVGFGMDFLTMPPDGGPIPVNECEAGDGGVLWNIDAGANIPQPFDASQWTGVQFFAKSSGHDLTVEIHIDDDRTTPWGQVPLDAGGCNACRSEDPDVNACSDSFAAPVTLLANSWMLVQVPFSSLQSDNWAHNVPRTAPIHANKIYNLHFQVSKPQVGSAPEFSLSVAYVSFYK